MRRFIQILIILLAIVGLNQSLSAQSFFTLDKSSKMTIEGTSSMHDWVSDVTVIKGSGSITLEGNKMVALDRVKVEIPVHGIKSGKSIMDDKTYGALLMATYPNIQFTLSSIDKITDNAISARGLVTVAGKTKTVSLPLNYHVNNGRVEVSGIIPLKMSDFGIDPPTALFGTLETGNDIKINFDVILKL